MKKLICTLIALTLGITIFTSCNTATNNASSATAQQVTTEQAKQIVNTLLPKASEISLWYYDPPVGEQMYGDVYAIADIEGVSDTEELKAATESIFSQAYCEKHFFKEIGTVSENKRFADIDGMLYAMSGGVSSTVTWHTDSLAIVEQSADALLLKMEFEVEAAGRSITYSGDLRLVQENGGWRIDSPIRSGGDIEGENKILNEKELRVETAE